MIAEQVRPQRAALHRNASAATVAQGSPGMPAEWSRFEARASRRAEAGRQHNAAVWINRSLRGRAVFLRYAAAAGLCLGMGAVWAMSAGLL